jgi:hypothetical protein
VTLRLKATCRLADLLNHLYVLIPVLDLKKHYFIQGEEIDKLIDKSGEWLRAHPDRALIARRYLRRRRSLANEAIAGWRKPMEQPQTLLSSTHLRDRQMRPPILMPCRKRRKMSRRRCWKAAAPA